MKNQAQRRKFQTYRSTPATGWPSRFLQAVCFEHLLWAGPRDYRDDTGSVPASRSGWLWELKCSHCLRLQVPLFGIFLCSFENALESPHDHTAQSKRFFSRVPSIQPTEIFLAIYMTYYFPSTIWVSVIPACKCLSTSIHSFEYLFDA